MLQFCNFLHWVYTEDLVDLKFNTVSVEPDFVLQSC